MAIEGITKTYKAGAAITKYRIVKFGADDDHVVQAAAVSDSILGVADSLGEDTTEGPVDIILDGIANVEYGGNITRGAKLTTDANGKAVAAAPAAGTNNQIIGIAMLSGVSGDIGKVLIQQGTVQG